LTFKNLLIFQSLKFRILMEKSLPISLKFHSKYFGLLRVKVSSIRTPMKIQWGSGWIVISNYKILNLSHEV